MRVFGLPTVFSESVKKHYMRLRKPLRLQGLWAWAEISTSLHEANLPIHSGTVPVERLWSLVKSFLPPQGHRLSKPWFDFLSSLTFIRATLLHVHSRSMPGWTDNDALLMQRADSMLDIARAWQGDPEYASFLEEIKLNIPAGKMEGAAGKTEDAAILDDMLSSAAAESVYMRILEPIWSDAMAAGLKRVETQRFKQRLSTNPMKFAVRGSMMAFGTSEFLQGIAVLAGSAVRNCQCEDLEDVFKLLHEDYHAPLCEYLSEGHVYDYVEFADVFDLRHLRLSWSKVWEDYSAKRPGQHQGFPKIGGLGLYMQFHNLVAEMAEP